MLTVRNKCVSTWKTTYPTSTQSTHSGSFAFANLTAKNMATTAEKEMRILALLYEKGVHCSTLYYIVVAVNPIDIDYGKLAYAMTSFFPFLIHSRFRRFCTIKP